MSASELASRHPAAGDFPQVADRLRDASRRGVRRRVLVVAGLVLAVLGVAFLGPVSGEAALSPAQLVDVVLGRGDVYAEFVLVQLRLPRLLLAVLVGAAFALAGGLFQSVLRNPLASPDIIGISQGASVGAVAATLLWGWTGLAVSGAAVVGALVVAGINLAVASGGGVSGFRFVLSGIGLAFVGSAVVNYLLTRSDVREAQVALHWMTGSVTSADYDSIRQLALVLVVLVPLGLGLARALEMLEMGDDSAAALGVRPVVVRCAALLLGVGLAAAATAVAGPIAFVALTAAPIARRLVGDGRVSFVATLLVGVLLVVLADHLAQHVLPRAMPVGIITGLVGGPYLIWLLATSPLTRGSR